MEAMKPADPSDRMPLPGLPSEGVETDADARKVHAADAAKAWRWIRLRLNPEMSDDEVRTLVLSVLCEKQPHLEAESGIVERLTAAALRQRHGDLGSSLKPGAARRPLPFISRIPPKQLGLAALALVALMLVIDPMMTLFVLGASAPFIALFLILRAFRGGQSGGGSGGCSGGSCGV
jgi:hypothetical protein